MVSATITSSSPVANIRCRAKERRSGASESTAPSLIGSVCRTALARSRAASGGRRYVEVLLVVCHQLAQSVIYGNVRCCDDHCERKIHCWYPVGTLAIEPRSRGVRIQCLDRRNLTCSHDFSCVGRRLLLDRLKVSPAELV